MKPLFSFKATSSILAMVGLAVLPATPLLALSLNRESPQIHFPPKYDEKRAENLSAVISSEKFHYLGGLTTLVYEGDANSLNSFLADLNRVEGLLVRITFSPDLSKETGSALQAGSWWLIYSHVTPDTVTVRLNLAAETLKGDTLEVLLPKQ
jgi:hypothetical protein